MVKYSRSVPFPSSSSLVVCGDEPPRFPAWRSHARPPARTLPPPSWTGSLPQRPPLAPVAAALFISRRMKPAAEERPTVEVTREDQDDINAYALLVQRRSEQVEALAVR